MTKQIAVLEGDGIGPEIIGQAVKVLDKLIEQGLDARYEYGLLGGAAYDVHGSPYPEATQNLCRKADAVLLGAVGGPQYDNLERSVRPERGLLAIRKDLNLFANLRPAILYPELANASTLKPEVVSGLDILIVRELTGDIYFGEPRGIRTLENGEKEGYNTMKYSESEIRRIAKVAFEAAQKRGKKLCSVDKANVLETTEFWKQIFTEVAAQYPDVELTHMYVDNAAMQLVKAPKQFDVIATGNIFGDILSDQASMLTGSIGMLPSASLNDTGKGLYEPSHGSTLISPVKIKPTHWQPFCHWRCCYVIASMMKPVPRKLSKRCKKYYSKGYAQAISLNKAPRWFLAQTWVMRSSLTYNF